LARLGIHHAGTRASPSHRPRWPDAIGERFFAKAVARIVKRAVMVAGFDPANFAGRSLRRGFATSGDDAGSTWWP